MDLWTIIFRQFVLLLVTLYRDEVDGNSYMDTIKVEGVTCNFAEYKTNDGGGPRGLRLYSCKNVSGNMNIDCTYFGGNPHGCKIYKPHVQKSIAKYYRTLARSAMNNGNPCRPSSITESFCDKHYPCYNGSCMNQHVRDEL
ncbi:uncharacterized protein LOC124268955 isoform X3 [Haliotis rubra]|uniref:uncharacterized protein LOC124268955 isoform X3 n=1 Tax=Haliotis rubra TaxID=36100 RepID=UPI001EE51F2A|nr:uncharacterized protein LOC124268955 isoform X3 [Haliotis rubra]